MPMKVGPPTADGSYLGSQDSGTRYGAAWNRCRKTAWLSRRYSFLLRTNFQIWAVLGTNRVFNGILRTGYFYDAWKRGKVNTIPKPRKDPRSPSNIRSITLLSHVAKTFKHALC
ncbi:Probable RNA-directed DNA polymerase from transposon X-element [Eumeta japonica]|uniref:Probable RNA-directed DNA polymerase from transposon X-element n=1 Tax=Eumeta variegata TaxID=151549 RepID=A0A4C1ZEF5_EUMVA|nr:Probable RNA-directed DNA polymerase from transposon X-element [Eumeta japonica]